MTHARPTLVVGMGMSEKTEGRLQKAALLGAYILLGPAALAAVVALGAFAVGCENCEPVRSWEDIWQLVAAVGGLSATVVMTVSVSRRAFRVAACALIAAVVLFSLWAVLLDAATHGWGKGPVPL